MRKAKMVKGTEPTLPRRYVVFVMKAAEGPRGQNILLHDRDIGMMLRAHGAISAGLICCFWRHPIHSQSPVRACYKHMRCIITPLTVVQDASWRRDRVISYPILTYLEEAEEAMGSWLMAVVTGGAVAVAERPVAVAVVGPSPPERQCCPTGCIVIPYRIHCGSCFGGRIERC